MRTLPKWLSISMLLLSSCSPETPSTDWANVQELTPTFLQDASATDPALAVAPDGRVALSWIVRDTSGGADVWIAVSADSGTSFGEPVRINPRAGRVSSYTESRPVAAFGPDGQLLVVWAAKRDSGEYADDLMSRGSSDGGRTFGPAAFLNSDHINVRSTYHGFATVGFLPDGRAVAAWIDGRASLGAEEPSAGEIYASILPARTNEWQRDTRIAGDVCACCRIQLAPEHVGGNDAHVALAYRGMRGDLRDPRVAVLRTDSLAVVLDTLVSADHWFLRGCPSVGPGLTFNRQEGGHYLWFTGESAPDSAAPAKLTPAGVYLQPWRTDGAAAGPRLAMLDSLRDASRPVLAESGGTTLIAVVGHPRADSTRSTLAVRMLERNDRLTPWVFLGAGVRAGALAGHHAHSAYAAWVEKQGERTHVRLARITRRGR